MLILVQNVYERKDTLQVFQKFKLIFNSLAKLTEILLFWQKKISVEGCVSFHY